MLKNIVVLLSVFTLCAYSDALYAVSADVENQLQNLVDKSDDVSGMTFSDFDDIEQEIKKLNPELVEQNKDKSQEERLQIYRSFIMQKTFDWYKDYFQQRIQERATLTGREIKKENERWHLDNGRLDTSECFEQNPESWCYKWPICPRPQGHESVWILWDDTMISYVEDHADENLTYNYMILMNDEVGNTDDTKSQSMMFETSAFAENYDYTFEEDNSVLEYRARYSKYTKKEFEKMQDKTAKEINKIDKNFDKDEAEINRILKEKGLVYKTQPDVESETMVVSKTHTILSNVNITSGAKDE